MVSSSAIADRLTVKLMLGLVPSNAGFGVPSEIETVGSAWSSMMLPVPSASVMASGSLLVSRLAAERWTVKASGVSKMASLSTGMVMMAVVAPAGMVTVTPVAPVKSVPATALPLTVL